MRNALLLLAMLKVFSVLGVQKLPVPESLDSLRVYSWHLPDSLEPAADMYFCYGVKGVDADANVKLPLFVYLHGSGERNHEFDNAKLLCRQWRDTPSAYFFPRIPNEGPWYRWYQRSKQWAYENMLVQVFDSELIDPDRVYMLGISEGGYGSQRLASFYGDFLAGAGPMAAGEPLKNAPVENLGHTAFCLRTGERDSGFYRNKLTVETGRALDSIAAIYPERYTHYVSLEAGRGHAIDYEPTTPWLSQHKRNPYPCHYRWENFEMDTRRRNAFHNIVVNAEALDSVWSRYSYTVDIDTVLNRVELNVEAVRYICTEVDPIWGIELMFSREYRPAGLVDVTLCFNERLFDPCRPLQVHVNGVQVYEGVLEASDANVASSYKTFMHDPRRAFPYAVTIRYPELVDTSAQ